MKVDVENSQYQECADLSDFSRDEKKMARFLLRRLRYLETKLAQAGRRPSDGEGAEMYVEWEADALEWALTEIGFIEEKAS